MKQTRPENPRNSQLNSYLDAVSPQLHFSFHPLGQMMNLHPQQLLCPSNFISTLTLLRPLLLFQQPMTIYNVETKTNQVRTSQSDVLRAGYSTGVSHHLGFGRDSKAGGGVGKI